jgi:hypothetical protein
MVVSGDGFDPFTILKLFEEFGMEIQRAQATAEYFIDCPGTNTAYPNLVINSPSKSIYVLKKIPAWSLTGRLIPTSPSIH